MQVSNRLAMDLDKLIRNYRTHDRKELTEGEVIVALGFMLAHHVKTHERIAAWMQQITIAALDAIKEFK